MDMISKHAYLLLLCLPFTGSAQQWEEPGIPFPVIEMYQIYNDTVGDALYFSGLSDLNNDTLGGDAAIAVYRDGQWDTLGVFGGSSSPATIVRWGDTIVVAGVFQSVNGIPMPDIVGYHNGQWFPFGDTDLDNVYRLRVVDGALYVMGAFQAVDGLACKGIARREGGGWVNVGTMNANTANIQDLVSFQGELVAAGVFHIAGEGRAIARFDGAAWHILGPGILPSIGAAGRTLAVYNGELYVSGAIDIDAGNPGHGIMRWDGTQFHAVGTGLQTIYNNYQYLVGGSDMTVYDGRLWVSGSFHHAGHVPARGVAIWDGSQWCGLPDMPINDFQLPVNVLAFFHDTLYVSTYDVGLPASCALRYVGPLVPDTCSMAVGVEELQSPTMLHLRPNPATGEVVLELASAAREAGWLLVYDARGQLVQRHRVPALATRVSFHVAGLAPGMYHCRYLAGQTPVGAGNLVVGY